MTRARARTDAAETLDRVLAEAANDRDRIAALADVIEELTEVTRRARALRDATAIRLREYGVPTTEVARLARVTDSYLARNALAAGAPRRVTRRAGG